MLTSWLKSMLDALEMIFQPICCLEVDVWSQQLRFKPSIKFLTICGAVDLLTPLKLHFCIPNRSRQFFTFTQEDEIHFLSTSHIRLRFRMIMTNQAPLASLASREYGLEAARTSSHDEDFKGVLSRPSQEQRQELTRRGYGSRIPFMAHSQHCMYQGAMEGNIYESIDEADDTVNQAFEGVLREVSGSLAPPSEFQASYVHSLIENLVSLDGRTFSEYQLPMTRLSPQGFSSLCQHQFTLEQGGGSFLGETVIEGHRSLVQIATERSSRCSRDMQNGEATNCERCWVLTRKALTVHRVREDYTGGDRRCWQKLTAELHISEVREVVLSVCRPSNLCVRVCGVLQSW